METQIIDRDKVNSANFTATLKMLLLALSAC